MSRWGRDRLAGLPNEFVRHSDVPNVTQISRTLSQALSQLKADVGGAPGAVRAAGIPLLKDGRCGAGRALGARPRCRRRSRRRRKTRCLSPGVVTRQRSHRPLHRPGTYLLHFHFRNSGSKWMELQMTTTTMIAAAVVFAATSVTSLAAPLGGGTGNTGNRTNV